MFGPQDSICFPAPLRDLSRIRKLGPDGKLEEEVQVMSELGFEVGMLVMLFFWLGAAWVKSRAERPSVSEVN